MPSNLFVQGLFIQLDGFMRDIRLSVVFGIKDNLLRSVDDCVDNEWTIMNEKWDLFQKRTNINQHDLWPNGTKERKLWNAKLYPLINHALNRDDIEELNQFCWLKLADTSIKSVDLIDKWRSSLRLSLDDILSIINFENLFRHRRSIFNHINNRYLVNSVVENRCIPFGNLIKNAIYDGYSDSLLKLFDRAALNNAHSLIILPRLMSFISSTLFEMAVDYNGIRSGPNANARWLSAFDFIENGQYEQAVHELCKERKNWIHRHDLLIRASRHYEGAMLSFIRQSTSSFKNLDDVRDSLFDLSIRSRSDL